MRLVYNSSYCLWFSSYLKINQNDFVLLWLLIKDSVRNLIQRGISYNRIGSYYQSLHLYATWMSSRSVKKFGKRYDNFIVITTVVRWEHHTYNRTLTSLCQRCISRALRVVAPTKHEVTACDLLVRAKPVPYFVP